MLGVSLHCTAGTSPTPAALATTGSSCSRRYRDPDLVFDTFCASASRKEVTKKNTPGTWHTCFVHEVSISQPCPARPNFRATRSASIKQGGEIAHNEPPVNTRTAVTSCECETRRHIPQGVSIRAVYSLRAHSRQTPTYFQNSDCRATDACHRLVVPHMQGDASSGRRQPQL